MAVVSLQPLLYRLWTRGGPFTLQTVRGELDRVGIAYEDTEINAELRRLGYVYDEGSYSAPQAELEARIAELESRILELDTLATDGLVALAEVLDEDDANPNPHAQALRDRLTAARRR